MKFKMFNLIVLVFLFFSLNVNAEKDVSVQGLMAVSKMSGACGIMKLMVDFQDATKMPNGDEFIIRFWSTEAARMGLQVKEYTQRCNEAITSYEHLWKTMDDSN